MVDILRSGLQGLISGPLLFNIYYDLLFNEIDIDFASYANEAIPQACDSKIEVAIEILVKNIDKIFQEFSDQFLQSNSDKSHFLTKKFGEVSVSVKYEKTTNSSKKVLGIQFEKSLCFDGPVTHICKKVWEKLCALY